MKKTKPFLYSYYHDGFTWSVTLHAYDWDDAEARARKLGNLRLDGELIAEIPAHIGWFAKSLCRVKNIFK